MNLEKLETRTNTGNSKKLYTGIANIQIIAVNPTREQIAQIYGVEVDKTKEPNYSLENSTRIDFWYREHTTHGTPLLGKFALFISNEYRVSQAGKNQYIDAHSRSAWADSISDLSDRNKSLPEFGRLQVTTARQAFKGEEDILNLMKTYGNIDVTNGPFMLDNFLALTKGNVKEVQDFFDHFNNKNGGVKILLGVKDAQYQDVCTLAFFTLNGKITEYHRNRIVDSNYGYKHYYGNSFDFKEFIAEAEPQQSNESMDWSTTSANKAEPSPFKADEDIFF